jgi:hypothetical protein
VATAAHSAQTAFFALVRIAFDAFNDSAQVSRDHRGQQPFVPPG